MKRLARAVPAVLLVLGSLTMAAPVSASATVSASETWVLKGTWGKPPRWIKLSEHPSLVACEEAGKAWIKDQWVGTRWKCVVG